MFLNWTKILVFLGLLLILTAPLFTLSHSRAGFLSEGGLVLPVAAQNDDGAGLQAARKGLQEAAQKGGLPKADEEKMTAEEIAGIVGLIINSILAFLGLIFMILLIYSGFLWMTAAGNEEQVKKARQILTTSIIGLVVILGSYVIMNFVLGTVLESALGGI